MLFCPFCPCYLKRESCTSFSKFLINFFDLITSESFAQIGNAIDLEAIKDKVLSTVNLDEIKSKLPPGIELPDLDKLGETTKTIEDTQKVLREKCIKVSGSDAAFEEAQQAVQTLTACIQDLVNITVIKQEIDEATPKGELETVFNKYCRKKQIAIDCVASFTESIDPCLEPKERENKKTIVDIATGLVNFVCHKDGDQIACKFKLFFRVKLLILTKKNYFSVYCRKRT